MRRWWCRVVGHDWGPWIHIALLGEFYSATCLRCGTKGSINANGWYAEHYRQELVKKGWRHTAMKGGRTTDPLPTTDKDTP
jgi:hypothetical protein